MTASSNMSANFALPIHCRLHITLCQKHSTYSPILGFWHFADLLLILDWADWWSLMFRVSQTSWQGFPIGCLGIANQVNLITVHAGVKVMTHHVTLWCSAFQFLDSGWILCLLLTVSLDRIKIWTHPPQLLLKHCHPVYSAAHRGETLNKECSTQISISEPFNAPPVGFQQGDDNSALARVERAIKCQVYVLLPLDSGQNMMSHIVLFHIHRYTKWRFCCYEVKSSIVDWNWEGKCKCKS